ncbi:HD-GYP domain-containing protein [Marinobacteraceae bacterium S3BR75-40.1]
MAYTEIVETSVTVDQLRIGMYVTRLDRPWSETDFPMQGFLIRSNDDIQALREHCQFVYIEGQVEVDASVSSAKGRPTGASPHVRKRTTYIHTVSMEEEMANAMDSFHECRSLAKDILASVRLGKVIELNKVRPVVQKAVSSIMRNSNALMWLTRIRTKDGYTAEHCMNVCVLAAAFGKHLGLLQGEIESLAISAMLHDVGKIKIRDEVLNKPGAFTPDEFREMKRHPEYGRRVLMSINGLEPIAVDVAHAHHERIDGNGYPRGLSGDQIPFFAKVVSVVDAYDAMTGHRVYDSARPSHQALDIIYKCRGEQFDEEIALSFIGFIGIYPPGCLVELTSGEIAIVLSSHSNNRLRPVTLVVLDKHHNPCRERVLDLSQLHADAGEPVQVAREWPNGSFGVDIRQYLERGLRLSRPTSSTDKGSTLTSDQIHAHYHAEREADRPH